MGRTVWNGFVIYGDVDSATLAGAAAEALRRLQADEHWLALHPRCGTNLASGVLAAVVLGETATLVLHSQALRRMALERQPWPGCCWLVRWGGRCRSTSPPWPICGGRASWPCGERAPEGSCATGLLSRRRESGADMFYILHGDEEFLRSEEVARLKAEILSDGMGDLNITTLDGRRVDLRELMDLCSTLPFLTQRRLIIVEGLLQRLEKRRGNGDEADATPAPVGDEAERLAAYLPTMPDTTRLVFVEAKIPGRAAPDPPAGRQAAERLRPRLPAAGGSDLQASATPARQKKGQNSRGLRRHSLPTYTGNDLRRLDAELEKLAALAGYQRAITADDVRALVTPDVENEIWNLVDALGHRQGRTAMRLLAGGLQQRKHEALPAHHVRAPGAADPGSQGPCRAGPEPRGDPQTLRLLRQVPGAQTAAAVAALHDGRT